MIPSGNLTQLQLLQLITVWHKLTTMEFLPSTRLFGPESWESRIQFAIFVPIYFRHVKFTDYTKKSGFIPKYPLVIFHSSTLKITQILNRNSSSKLWQGPSVSLLINQSVYSMVISPTLRHNDSSRPDQATCYHPPKAPGKLRVRHPHPPSVPCVANGWFSQWITLWL